MARVGEGEGVGLTWSDEAWGEVARVQVPQWSSSTEAREYLWRIGRGMVEWRMKVREERV